MILLRKESSVVGFIEIEHKAVIAKDREERIAFKRRHFPWEAEKVWTWVEVTVAPWCECA